MDMNKIIQVARIEEINILHNVRLINNHDLNPRVSKDNLTVQFKLAGEVKGNINCYLCLDDKEIGHTDRNYLFPLFIEAMNILIGKQVSLDPDLTDLNILLSPPTVSLNPVHVHSGGRQATHLYQLELDEISYDVLIHYNLEMMN